MESLPGPTASWALCQHSHPHTSVTLQMCYGVASGRARLQDIVHPGRNHLALANKKDTLPVGKQTSLIE